MGSLNTIRDTFFEECEDLLAALSEGLAAMLGGMLESETVNAVFRAVHSIKGGAGAFALADLVTFAHRFETVLDAVRGGRLDADADLLHILQRSADHLTDLVEAARNSEPADPDASARFLANLEACLADGGIADTAPDQEFSFAAVTLDFALLEPADSDHPTQHQFDIRFAPRAGLFANGHDPALLIATLAEFGSLQTTLDLSRLPDWGTFDLETPFLDWNIRLTTSASETSLHEVFDFVDGLCELEIRPVPEPVLEPQPDFELETNVPASLKSQAAPKADPLDPAADARAANPTLRVALERVDRLINAVGELIINQAMVAQRIQDTALAADADILAHVDDYRLLARDLQEAVMAIRAQPVKPLFQRMSRIVREAADATGKQVQFVTVGEATEVDKTLIERLADPLTHMIRNSVDHGLETPEVRLAAGKEACGTVRLSAAHRSGSVILSIRDDGAGLNRPRILETARRKGLIAADLDLADAEIDALLFLPGFSTAASVSNLSGRGVGLDVVRNAVTSLGGRVSITSIPGKGTEFTLTLPLTLAVMDGMVISVAGQTLVIPTISVLETIRPAPSDLHRVGTDEVLLRIRGQFIPTIDVARCLGFTATEDSGQPLLLIVETENQTQCALMVNAVHDQRQVVIKGLETNYGAVNGVSAATVLGDGRIALILDPDAIAAPRAAPFAVNAPHFPKFEGASHAG